MEKEYVRIQWENRPSIATPLGQINLNKMDYQIDKNENTLITFDTTKANQSDLLQTIRTLTYDTETGIFVFTFWNGSTYSVDLNIEKIPVTFSMDEYGVITMTTADGTTYTCDIGALIKLYTFVDGDEIDFVTTTDAGGNKTITASIKDGSIVGSKLQPNFLADCQAAKAQAELAATSASSDASDAELSSEDSEAWAVGERNGQPVPSTDPAYENNAKWWAQHGTGSSFAGLSDTNFTNLQNGQIAKYNSLTQKWENTEDEGGLLPHFKITSESGSTVSVVCPDTSVIIPEQTSSGIWQCDVPAYGVYTVHAVINGDDAVRTVTVDTVKEYVIHDEHYSYTLNVYAPTGSSILVTDGDDETYTGTGAGSTAVVFALHQASTTYTIEVTYDGLERDTTITSSATTGGSGSKTIEFGTINLTLDEDLIGETVVMTNGTASKSKVADSTSMVFYPNATGNWTISCEYDGETYYSEPNPIVVSSLSTAVSAEISLVHIPEGATVLPTDDIQTWLKCANITNKSYTTLAEVLADRETFETLIADSNACDYMARSTTWAKAEGAVPTLSGESANVLSKGDYSGQPAWKLFDGDDSTSWSADAPYLSGGAYVGYHFENSVAIYRIGYIKRYTTATPATQVFKVIGSNTNNINDGVDLSDAFTINQANDGDNSWHYVDLTSIGNYSYYWLYETSNNASQLYPTLMELQFYEADITHSQDAMALIGKYDYCSNALFGNATWAEAIANSDYFEYVSTGSVPKMTSNTTPKGEAYCNSAYGTLKAFNAFDRDIETGWHGAQNIANAYVAYIYEEKQIIRAFSLRIRGTFGGTKNITIFGANTGDSDVTVLHTAQINFVANVDYILFDTFSNDTAFDYYGVRFTEAMFNGSTYIALHELQFYGRASEVVFVPLIPTMTSDTTPTGTGTVIYSTQYSDQQGYKAFDKNSSTTWSPNAVQLGWIGFHFDKPTKVAKASVFQRLNGTFNGVTETATIQGSNTGNPDDWHDVSNEKTFVIMVASNQKWIDFDVDTSIAYTYYRMNVTAVSNVNVWATCSELQFYEKTVQTNIIHSAPNDTIYMLEDGVPTPICRTNEDGDGIFDFSELEEGVYTFGSTVAKNPNDLSEDFKKRFRITKSPYGGTTERYLLPDTIRTLYWYGRMGNGAEVISSANGWSTPSRTPVNPTFNTNNFDVSTNSGQICGIGAKNTVILSNFRAICKSTYDYVGIMVANAKVCNSAVSYVETNSSSYVSIGEKATEGPYYLFCKGENTQKGTFEGFWYESPIKATPTFISAANDSLYIMDGSTKIFIANTDGEGKSLAPMLEPGTYTIYSSVAKDPNNLSNPYSKTVTVDESTQTIAVMPNGALYWYGYEAVEFVANTYRPSNFGGGTVNTPNVIRNSVDIDFAVYGQGGAQWNNVDLSGYDSLICYSKLKYIATDMGARFVIANTANISSDRYAFSLYADVMDSTMQKRVIDISSINERRAIGMGMSGNNANNPLLNVQFMILE